ncbi:MAG: NAD-dependent epimerase/dehydratase family protein, partial [Bacteroidetes bacterium]
SVELGVKKIIHTSSAAVYGDDPELPKRINMKPAPKSPYGITKLDGEYYCNLYREHFELNTVSLRYFNVFGPKQDPKSQYAAAIPIFVEKAIKNENITIFGDGNQTRDFVFVKDIVKANWKAAINEQAFGVFNVANGNAITINELAEKVIEITNSKSKILYAEERPGDIKHSVADITETKEILGFAPSNNFDEELRITIDYFKKEKN